MTGAGQVFLLRLDAHSTVPGPEQTGRHTASMSPSPITAARTLLPLSGFLFIRDIDQSGDTVRGQWRGMMPDWNISVCRQPSRWRKCVCCRCDAQHPIAVIAPTGAVAELGVTTGWQREFVDPAGLQGAVPVWIVLQPDPVTCPMVRLTPSRRCPPRLSTATSTPVCLVATVRPALVVTMPSGRWQAAWYVVLAASRISPASTAPYGCPPAAPWWHNGIDLSAAHGAGIVAPMAGASPLPGR